MPRQIELSVANEKITAQAYEEAGIVVQTFYSRRKECGGLKASI
jgi:hypothetical protein